MPRFVHSRMSLFHPALFPLGTYLHFQGFSRILSLMSFSNSRGNSYTHSMLIVTLVPIYLWWRETMPKRKRISKFFDCRVHPGFLSDKALSGVLHIGSFLGSSKGQFQTYKLRKDILEVLQSSIKKAMHNILRSFNDHTQLDTVFCIMMPWKVTTQNEPYGPRIMKGLMTLPELGLVRQGQIELPSF